MKEMMWLQTLLILFNLTIQTNAGLSAFRLDPTQHPIPLAACDSLGETAKSGQNDTRKPATSMAQVHLKASIYRPETTHETTPLAPKSGVQERLEALKNALRGPPHTDWDITNDRSVVYSRFALGSPVVAKKAVAALDPADGFSSFNQFKKVFGKAGDNEAWHHVVEQTINKGKFAPEILHNPGNLFKLPHGSGTIHSKLSGFYSSKQPFTGGLRVREWLSKKSFMEQFEFGIQKIKDFGGAKYLPPELR